MLGREQHPCHGQAVASRLLGGGDQLDSTRAKGVDPSPNCLDGALQANTRAEEPKREVFRKGKSAISGDAGLTADCQLVGDVKIACNGNLWRRSCQSYPCSPARIGDVGKPGSGRPGNIRAVSP